MIADSHPAFDLNRSRTGDFEQTGVMLILRSASLTEALNTCGDRSAFCDAARRVKSIVGMPQHLNSVTAIEDDKRTMRDDCEHLLQQRAYAIWESEGRPHGRDREHWEQAEREQAADRAPGIPSAPESTPVKKPRKRTAPKLSASTARTGKKKAAAASIDAGL
jgi:hypothetical protein